MYLQILSKMDTILLISLSIIPFVRNTFSLPTQLLIYLPKYIINEQ